MNQKWHKITLEMLSAYLDNQLSEKDNRKVESALQINPALKQELSMLDATRRLLRNAPVLKVPRNFTLSVSMVAKQNPFKFWMPAMSFSSALAAVLFVLSFIFNFNPVGTALTVQTRNMEQFTASDSIAAESMIMADESGKNAVEETPMIIQWFGNTANGMGGGGPATTLAEGEIMADEAAPMAAEAPAYEMEPESDMNAMEAGAGAADSALSEMPAEEPAPAIAEALPAAKDGPIADSDGGFTPSDNDSSYIILGVSPEEERGQIIEESQQVLPPIYQEESLPSNQNSTLLLILRGGLLLLSVTFAIIAYLMHRQRA